MEEAPVARILYDKSPPGVLALSRRPPHNPPDRSSHQPGAAIAAMRFLTFRSISIPVCAAPPAPSAGDQI